MSKFFITTAIPYVNAKPHIGFALELVQTDAVARWHRLNNDEVWFLTGTDENALKNVQAAEQAGQATADFVTDMSQKFKQLGGVLNISNDDFIRTTEDRHVRGAKKLWSACKEEDIYRKSYTGQYCVGCEQFYTESELVNGLCPEHKVQPEQVAEENYFFKLSNYQIKLEQLITSGELRIIPESRKNEMLAFIRRGLEDFSVSRSIKRAKGWGVTVPGDDSQVMYVWFDALSNYITALDYADNGDKYQQFWLNNQRRVHVIGKGISRFHCIYWPAMLLSAGVPLPTEIFIHGYITVEGEKISKSLGNTVDPVELVERYGTDPVRYYLLREISAYEDGDYSEEKFLQRYHSDLANGLGNTLSRVTNMIASYSEGRVVKQNKVELDVEQIAKAMADWRFDVALTNIMAWVKLVDGEVEQTKPWQLAKESQTEELNKLLSRWHSILLQVGESLAPFIPATSQKIATILSAEKITKAEPLFPRLDS